MEKAIVEKLRSFTNGFEKHTFEISKSYASECDNLDHLVDSIRDDLLVSNDEWDTQQDMYYDENDDLVIITVVGYHPEDDSYDGSPFLKIIVPENWK